jgi:hypothetical protein
MESDPIIEELWRIKDEIWAECGYDIRRLMENARRNQYLRGRDLYGRSKVTGRIEVVWRAPRREDAAQDSPTAASSDPAAAVRTAAEPEVPPSRAGL